MRYHLDSELPINAFSPRGGRGVFARSMTLEGGGGGLLGGVTKALGSVAGAITGAVKGVVQPVYNATLKNIPGVDKALVSLDKSVGKAIPGGWGTVAAVASSFIPGGALMGLSQTQLATGLGALSGSGVMKKGNEFNLQGAIMGGALAYGASTLSQGLQNPTATDKLVTENIVAPSAPTPPAPGSGYVPEGGMPGSPSISAPPPSVPPPSMAKDVFAGYSPTGSEAATQAYTPPPSMLDKVGTSISNIPSNIESGIKSLGESGSKFLDAATSADTYKGIGTKLADTASGTLDNMGKAVTNAGSIISGSASLPASVGLTNTALPMLIGGTGLAALEEQKKYLDEQAAAGAISNAEYNASKSKIDAQIEAAKKVVSEHPLQSSVDISNVSNAPTTYAKNFDTLYEKTPTRMYANGGQVTSDLVNALSSNPPDDQTGMPTQSPMTNFGQPGIMSMVDRTVPQQTFASGGIASGRFLSGGGDGMSDSIPANINGSQEARLADGEFVVPADVVSHLGNGSSKAGAKQLYSMMDKVRQARVGTKKQGKQINPRKYLAA